MKYVVVVTAILAALSPALFFSFGYHNDYNAWAYNAQSCCTNHPETLILNAIGRYFGAIAQNFQFLTIVGLRSLWIWRLLGILSVAFLAAYYLKTVSANSEAGWQTVFLTIAIFTLPTMQFQAIWVSMYMFWTPPILLSLVAVNFFVKASTQQGLSEMFRLTACGLVALLAGLFFYPASATFVLVPVAHLLLIKDSLVTRKVAVFSVGALGGAFVSLFLIHRFIVLPHFLSHVPYLGEYEFKITENVLTESARRIGVYLQDGANLWLGMQIPLVPRVVGVLALIGFVIGVLRRGNKTEWLGALGACFLFLVVAGPLIVVQQFTQTLRVTFAMTSIELLVFFFLLKQLSSKAIRIALVFAGLGVVSAFFTVYGVSASAASEHALYAQSISGLDGRGRDRDHFAAIVVLRPLRQRQAFGFNLRNDFGALAPIHHVFDLLIGTRYNGKAAFDVTEFRLPQVDGAPIALEQNALIEDTSRIYDVPNFRNVTDRVGLVSAQPRGVIGPMYAIDKDPASFWEVCDNPQPYPIEFKVVLPSQVNLKGYTLSTIEETIRMPNAWEVWVNSDASNWTLVQQVTGAGGWKIRESRHYEFAVVPNVKAIKLIIKGADVGPCMRLYEFTPETAP